MENSKRASRDNSTPRIHGEEAFQQQDKSINEDLDNRHENIRSDDPAAFDYDVENEKEREIKQDEIDSEDENNT